MAIKVIAQLREVKLGKNPGAQKESLMCSELLRQGGNETTKAAQEDKILSLKLWHRPHPSVF